MRWALSRVPGGVVAALALQLLTAQALEAQATGTVRGRVVEVGTQRPIADVQVTVAGTTSGAVTNASGDYTITAVPAGSRELSARRIGYARRTLTIAVAQGETVTADFTLSQAASQLEAVVVTGTAGAQEKRTIGNAVTQLPVAELTQRSTVMNVTDVLQGRTPGVAVSVGSGAPGTASSITIRGAGSFTNNQPVVYIDGVRMDTDDLGSFSPSGAGTTGYSGQRTSALDMINPQDIESMEVIKGPAAATLYGADAAAGVIQIITKKGTRGQQPLKFTARFETGWNAWGADKVTNYTTCTQALIDARDAAGNILWPGCHERDENGEGIPGTAVPVGTILTDTPLERDPNAMRDGNVQNVSLSLRGGGDRYSFYASVDGIQNQGVFFNSNDDRRSLRTNFTFNPMNTMDFGVNVGYIRSRIRLPLGDEAFNGLLLSAARGRPGLRKPTQELYGWGSVAPTAANAYNNQTVTDRVLLGTTVNYNPLSWLRNRVVAGMDLRSSTAQVLSLPGDIDVPAGLNAMRAPRSYNYTLDYSSTADFGITSDIQSTTSVGGQVISNKTETIGATGSQLPTREITTIGAALSVSGYNAYSELNSVGAYLQQQLGWRDRLFLTGAIRADDASSFGTDFDAIIYPKASVSYVISDEPAVESYLDAARINSMRLRGAWGQAGRAPAAFSAVQTYGSTRVALGPNGVGGAMVASQIGNPDLKPERGEEIELGFDSELFDGRAGIDFTWYRKDMEDLLVPIALPPSLGFAGSMLQNLGSTRNSGVELGLSGTALDLPNFIWEPRISYSRNSNILTGLDTIRSCKTWELAEGEECPPGKSAAEEIPGGASYSPGMQRNRVGYPLGSYFLRFPARDANGNYVFNTNASGQITSAVYETDFRFVGPAVPTRLLSFSNTFTVFKNFRVYALLDHQGGHYLFNYKEFNRCVFQTNCARLNRADVTAEERALYGTNGNVLSTASASTQTLYTEKADFTKLRDLSVTFMVPTEWARMAKLASADLVLSGRNLYTWTDYSGLDPEVNGYSNNQLRGSGNSSQFTRVDAYSLPSLKRYTMTVNLTY